MPAVSFHMLAQISTERLLNSLAEGLAIALFAWVLLRLVGRQNSGTRFVVWFCALVAIAVSPFVSFGSSANLTPGNAAVTIPGSWSFYLFGAWAFLAMIGLARVLAGLWHLHAVRKSCVAVDSSTLDASVAETLNDFRAARSVQLLSSEALRVPTAIGFFRPAVIVPAWALRDLGAAELNAVLLHELAHLRRWDDWTNLAQKVLRAIFFFHPAVWWVENRLSLEREMACDDLVLAHTANPRVYAECLVSLAEKNLLQRGIALAQAAVGRMRQTSLRVLQILDARRPQGVKVWQPAPWVVAGFSVVCLATAAHAPKLIAFGEPAMNNVAQIPSGSLASSELSYVPPVVPAKFVADENHLSQQANVRSGKSFQGTGERSLRTRQTAHVRSNKKSANSPISVMPSPERRAQPARVVRTAVTETQPVVVMQEAVYIFVQDTPFSPAPVIWKFSVWQIRVAPEMRARITPEIPSKSI
jgi:beta-lactamase regulating signal transducer with metallopeptidase domain